MAETVRTEHTATRSAEEARDAVCVAHVVVAHARSPSRGRRSSTELRCYKRADDSGRRSLSWNVTASFTSSMAGPVNTSSMRGTPRRSSKTTFIPSGSRFRFKDRELQMTSRTGFYDEEVAEESLRPLAQYVVRHSCPGRTSSSPAFLLPVV